MSVVEAEVMDSIVPSNSCLTPLRDVIRKGNALIEAVADLSLQECRFLVFVSSIIPSDFKVEEGRPLDLQVDVNEFIKCFGVSQKNAYREIKSIADKLMTKIIEFIHTDGDEVRVAFLARRKYNEGKGRIEIRIDENIVPQLINLKENFTQYNIKNVCHFRKSYSFRVYEMLKRFHRIKKREIDICEFKRKLGVSDKYDRFVDLKRVVIEPSIKEINELSDIEVQCHCETFKRKVVKLVFIIKDNEVNTSPQMKLRAAAEKLDAGENFCPELEELLKIEFRVSPKQARQIANLAKGREEHVRKKLPRIKSRYEALSEKKTSIGGYTFSALKSELIQAQKDLPL